ncbi:MAG TPA: histidine phosphatase family protein [Reyranellaceae bacterium]|nr:histidine phosphatase family protein [Reyranellaceae bacterium]
MSGVPFALLRHAPTLWNESGRLQGAADIRLSRSGRIVAAGWRLPAPYDEWRRLASPLTRARQTAALLKPIATFGVERRLHEVRFGLWEGRVIAEIEAMRRRRSFAPGGEPPPQLKRRLRDWAAGLARAGEPAVGVTHKGVIRAVRRLARVRGEWRDDCLQVFTAYADGTIALEAADVALVIER